MTKIKFGTDGWRAIIADDFTVDNDPHREHDFGSFELEDEKPFWMIDYCDLAEKFGSEYLTDPKKTLRVLTGVLAEEY